LNTKEGMLAALGSPCLSTRYMAVQKLRSAPKAAIPVLSESASFDESRIVRARCVRQLMHLFSPIQYEDDSPLPQNLYNIVSRQVSAGLTNKDSAFREMGVRWYADSESDNPLLIGTMRAGARQNRKFLSDPTFRDGGPALYRELLLFARLLPVDIAKPLVME